MLIPMLVFVRMAALCMSPCVKLVNSFAPLSRRTRGREVPLTSRFSATDHHHPKKQSGDARGLARPNKEITLADILAQMATDKALSEKREAANKASSDERKAANKASIDHHFSDLKNQMATDKALSEKRKATNKASSDHHFSDLKNQMATDKALSEKREAANKALSDEREAANKASIDLQFSDLKNQMATDKASSDLQFSDLKNQMAINKASSDRRFSKLDSRLDSTSLTLQHLTNYNAKRDRELEQLAVNKFNDELEFAGWTVHEIHASKIRNNKGKDVLEWDGYLLGTNAESAKLFVFETTKQAYHKDFYDKFLTRLAKMKTSVLPEILHESGGQFQKHTEFVQDFQAVLGPVKDKFQVVGVLCSPYFTKEMMRLIETAIVDISVVKMTTEEEWQVTIKV